MYEMTNGAALGYAIMAGEAAGLNTKQLERLVDAMQAAFDEVTVSQAESYYQHGNY